MVPPGQTPSVNPRAAGRGGEWVPVALALGLAGVAGILGAFLHWSLQRPQDWTARWSMEDEVTEDQSLHHARLAHGARFGPGKMGRGVHLPGKDSLVVLDRWVMGEHRTIEVWVKVQQPTAELQLIAGTTVKTSYDFGVGLSNGVFTAFYFDAQGNPACLSSGIQPATNRWYHLAAASDGRVARIHVDGELCAAAVAGVRLRKGSISGLHLGASQLLVRDSLVTTNCFTGILDQLSIYPRALSEAEVRALYRSSAIDPAGRRLAGDVLVSLAFALLITAGFVALAWRCHPESAGVLNLRTLTKSYRAVTAVLLVGLTLTGCLFQATRRESLERDQRRFHQLISEFLDRFDTRTESYVQNLTSLRNWLGGETDLTRERWDLMIESMQLWNDCPGLFSVGFAPIVRTRNLAAFESWAQSNIKTNFQVHWLSTNSQRTAFATSGSSNRTVAFPIAFHSHIYRVGDGVARQTEWGRDLLDPDSVESPETGVPLFAAAWSASKGQELSAGWPDELYRYKNTNASVVGTRVFLGVFTTRTNVSPVGQSLATASPGRRNLGILFGSFYWQQFMDSMLGAQKAEFRFTLFTPQRNGKRFVLAEHGPRSAPEATSADSLRTVYQSRFYGRRLHFEFETLPAFIQQSERRWPSVIGGIGIALSLGVAGLVFIQARARLKEIAAGRELRHSRDQLRHLLQDRERISRDLHDGIIQSIFGIGLGLKHSRKLIDRDPLLARTQLGESISELDGTISELRQFILSLEPELPSGESLIAALNALVQRTRRITNTQIQMNVDEKIETALSPYLSVHLMNLIREGLSNSVRHASANTITVSLQQDASRLRLQITDDGVGFNPDSSSMSGSGLRNMRARVRELGGALAITSPEGSGTTIVVILPLDPVNGVTSSAHSTS